MTSDYIIREVYYNTKTGYHYVSSFQKFKSSIFFKICVISKLIRFPENLISSSVIKHIIQHTVTLRERACHSSAPSTNMMCDESENE